MLAPAIKDKIFSGVVSAVISDRKCSVLFSDGFTNIVCGYKDLNLQVSDSVIVVLSSNTGIYFIIQKIKVSYQKDFSYFDIEDSSVQEWENTIAETCNSIPLNLFVSF